MQKIFTRILVLCLMLVVTSGIKAAEFPMDSSPITSGTVYTVRAYQAYNATFTHTASGTLIQDGCPDLKIKGLDETFIGWSGTYGQVYSWQVEAGTTYEIYCTFVMNNDSVSFAMEADNGIEIQRVLPAPGSELSPIANLTGDVTISLNTGVRISSAYL